MACPVLAYRMVLWHVRYWRSVTVLCGIRYCRSGWRYAVSGTYFAYGASVCTCASGSDVVGRAAYAVLRC
eukprot:3364786-Rhodomonas_salina.1